MYLDMCNFKYSDLSDANFRDARLYKVGFDFYTDEDNNGQLESWKIGGFRFEYVVYNILDDHGNLIDDIPVEHQLF